MVYILGITFFLLIFMIEECTGIFGKIIGGCLNVLDSDSREITFSNDLYKELSPEDQLEEF